MDWYEFLLFVHVLSAFALIAALVVFWCVIVATLRTSRPSAIAAYLRVARPATVLVIAGAVGTLVFGIWLAIYLDGYELWDGWIVGALVLWVVASETGRRASASARARGDALARRRWILWHTVRTVAVVLLLVLMIEKPGGV